MDKVKKKNRQSLTWSKKRGDESEENDMFSNIPQELILEILLKSSAESIAILCFVCKRWLSIIRDKDFTELYLTRASTRPRLLFIVHLRDIHSFISRSLEDPNSDCYRATLTPKPDSRYWFSPPVRGLICCFKDGLRKVIGTEEYQVFTLRAKEEWRMIESKLDRPTKCPISFNLASEEFNVIKFPEDSKRLRRPCELVNYGGKIALTDCICCGTLDLWILEDVIGNGEWFKFRGALSTGELIFVPHYSGWPRPFSFICYDLKVNHARKVVTQGLGDGFRDIKVFLDHVESPMFLVSSTNDVLIR
ncbi:putative F-box protein At4g29970 [Capsella rubella]|uniref:putative F-box protein At4g29970 n=1 Tax=Capsella rubella TaxID=81985 RepID=UPI000CD512D9|nr:putative F-box protein At4g29970 [Capsella rubella]